jgi:hypothetical protein
MKNFLGFFLDLFELRQVYETSKYEKEDFMPPKLNNNT